MKILIIDNNLHLKGYPQGLMVKTHIPIRFWPNITILKADKIGSTTPHADKVILTGSTAYVRQKTKWIMDEIRLIGHFRKKKIPMLGICFGSQLICASLFGIDSVEAMPVPFSGSMAFQQKGNCPLFFSLPKTFGVVSTHYEVTRPPEKFSIGKVEDISTYAFYFPPNIYGIQFHPELMGQLGKKLVWLQKKMFDRLLYQDFEVKTNVAYGRKIYENFLTLI